MRPVAKLEAKASSSSCHRLYIIAGRSVFEGNRPRPPLPASSLVRAQQKRVESDFRQEVGAGTTLKKLHDYVRDCSAVITGRRSGMCKPSRKRWKATTVSITRYSSPTSRKGQRRAGLQSAATALAYRELYLFQRSSNSGRPIQALLRHRVAQPSCGFPCSRA